MIEKVGMIKDQIQFYETVFKICLIGAVLFGLLTIFIYASFHIGKVFGQLSGVYRNREIIRIHQNNMVYGKQKSTVYQYSEEATEPLDEQMEKTVPLEEGNEIYQTVDPDFQSDQTVILGQPEKWI